MSWGAIAGAAAPYLAQAAGTYMTGNATAKGQKKQAKLAKKYRKAYMKAYKDAQIANATRAKEIKGDMAALKTRTLSNLEKSTGQAYADIDKNYRNFASNAGQDLVSRGLGGTTVNSTVQTGIEGERQASRNRETDRFNTARTNADVQLSQAEQAFNERITDAYPDPELVDLQLQLGMNPGADLSGVNYADILQSLAGGLGAGYDQYQQGQASEADPAETSVAANTLAGGGGGAATGYDLAQNKNSMFSPQAGSTDAGAAVGQQAALGGLTGMIGGNQTMKKKKKKMGMGQKYGALVGTVGGTALGGPIGGVVGGMAGPYIGQLVDSWL